MKFTVLSLMLLMIATIDRSIQSCEEDSDEDISDPDKAEDVQNQDLQNDSGNEEMPSTAEIRVRTQSRNRRSE